MATLIDIPHIEQTRDWDCGLACAAMVLGYCGVEVEEEDIDNACQKIGVKRSVWTIDLAHLMKFYGINHDFFTITFGVDPTYNSVDFYTSQPVEFSEEESRINGLFKAAANKGISAMKKSLDHDEIIKHLDEGMPAIVLIDSSILHCEICHENEGHLCPCLPSSCLNGVKEEEGYIGHFIVVCGYDLEEKQFSYKNPSRTTSLCVCSFENFDLARKAHGTDEDILFIKR